MTLDVTDLACARGGIAVLEGLSFTLAPGEALVLRGPNGIGKTTLLRTLAGLQPALSGQVVVAADSFAYSGHNDGIKAMLDVRENLRFWAAIHGQQEIETALRAMDLDALAERRAANLSAGQKRRLGLARLLVTGRPIWLLDEPTVSLDAASVALFGRVVAAHLDAGGAALIATHIDLGITARVLELAPYRAGEPGDGPRDNRKNPRGGKAAPQSAARFGNHFEDSFDDAFDQAFDEGRR